jgi:hypothetical protein
VGRKERWAGGLLGALQAEEVRWAGRKKKKDGPRWAGMREERFGFSFYFFSNTFSNFQKFKLFQNFFNF